jgi:hypothetical protein
MELHKEKNMAIPAMTKVVGADVEDSVATSGVDGGFEGDILMSIKWWIL